MSYSLTFNFRKFTFFSIAVLGFCLLPEVSFAQENVGKSERDMIKPSDKSNSENISPANETSSTVPMLNKSVATSPKVVPTKKEPVLITEGKKPESAPSTLNFNIFLYIVDKFRAD